MEDKKINIDLDLSEIYQLNLSVINRLSFVQMQWCNSISEAEQKEREATLSYLQAMSNKLANIIAENTKEGK